VTEVAGTWVDALLRTVAMLERLAVPYQIVGGAAAALYGVERPVHDIDLYVPARDLSRVAEACGERLGRPPGPHRDEHWDLTFLALEDSGLRVEIAGADAAYRDAHTGAWHAAAIDFDHATRLRVNQQTVRVMPIGQLVAYKRCLDRPVDRIDCAALDRARS
jgi:hypothetical protein